MSKRYLRHKFDGTIYEWNPILAEHPKCEEVTELQAFPERFVNKEQIEKVETSLAEKGVPALNLETIESLLADPLPIVNEDINRDATRGRGRRTQVAGLSAGNSA